jgi:hypothetical protein
LIEFTISVTPVKLRRAIKVFVYDDITDLRVAADYHNKKMGSTDQDNSKAFGITHRFIWESFDDDGKVTDVKPRVSIIRLHKDYLSAQVISHEAAHAALWIHELEFGENRLNTLDIDNEEVFCHTLDEIVDQLVHKLYKTKLL